MNDSHSVTAIATRSSVNGNNPNPLKVVGSGIYDGKHHRSLFKLIDKLESEKDVKSFVFSTASVPFKRMHNSLKESLIAKGFNIVGEFQCKGFMNHGFTRYILGGLCKGRPNEKDLKKAKEFAMKIKDSFQQ